MAQYTVNNIPFPSILSQQVYIGIDRDVFNYFAARQRASNWCWAAAIQMVLNYYGLDVNQEDFALRNCGVDARGNIINCPANVDVITRNLNQSFLDNRTNIRYNVKATVNRGIPDIKVLANYLRENVPVILAYQLPGANIGHAVVMTGLSFEENFFTNNNPLQTIIVRDPSPTNGGRIEYSNPLGLLNTVYAWWVPNVYEYQQ